MDFSHLPKVELHLHLDCSLSFEVVHRICPELSEQAYREAFIAAPKCTDLADFLRKAINGILLMQTRENLRLVTLDLLRQLKEERVIYAEIRFAPLEHLREGLHPEEVVETVLEALDEGVGESGVEVGLLLCTLRHYAGWQSMETARLVERYRGTRVVGFDIASDEANYPIDPHIRAFEFVRGHGIPCTAHAGEARGPDSVWETLHHFQPRRLGHGVRSAEDPRLLDFLLENDIHLEVCPTSNVQTNVYPSIAQHPVNDLYARGLSLGINTDGRALCHTTLQREYQSLHQTFGWGGVHFQHCNREALRHAFLPDAKKKALARRLQPTSSAEG